MLKRERREENNGKLMYSSYEVEVAVDRQGGGDFTLHSDLKMLSAYQALEHGCANHDTEGERFKSPIHCCDVTKPPYLFSGELFTSPLHSELLFVYIVCCRRIGQCFSVLRTRKSDVILT